MPLSAGELLGPYEILAPIGAGGMGEVYTARDTRLGRIVAIKRLKAEHTERFTREARAIAALNHPHICQIYDVGSDYLVMEYVQGEPLKRPLPPDEAVRLAIQIAEALEAAHSKGIIHRDLKPGNILVGTAGVKLLDFGLAKMEDSNPESGAFSTLTVGLTEAGVVVGTVAYMSPEQAQAQPLDARSDIFSFGLVLYEVLSGKRAFAGETPFATMSKIVSDEPLPLQAPAALERIVTRCLRKSMAERFQTMTEIRKALQQISAKPAEQQASIAVLPFANMSPDKEQEFFSDGLAEEILNALAKMPGLKVIARTSAFAFKGQNTDIRRIAEALGVTNILEGSVRKAGNRIRVTAQLIAAADGSRLWSERYDRELADVFAVQDEIAQAIASALHLKLGSGPARPRRYTPNLPAYEAFLRARHYWGKFSPEAFARSREYLEQAIALDPQFALAHGLLGESFLNSAHFSTMSAREAVPLIRASAQKALDLDPSLPEAHAMLGVVAGLHDHDWKEAELQFRLAMAQDPVSLDVRTWYAHSFLVSIGRAPEGVRELESVRHEDPVNATFYHMLAMCLQRSGREMEAEAEFLHVLDLAENIPATLIWLGHHYVSHGTIPEALACSERLISLIPWNSEVIGGFAGLLMRTGRPGEAKEWLQKLGDGKAYGASLGFIYFHLICGEFEAAADWIEKAIEERHFLAAIYLWSPLAKPLREGPRWPKLAKMMNLPETVS
jgi:TolB-like protein/predicted Ser/Thr protein kinase/Tfp pilus assembly protein PilF